MMSCARHGTGRHASKYTYAATPPRPTTVRRTCRRCCAPRTSRSSSSPRNSCAASSRAAAVSALLTAAKQALLCEFPSRVRWRGHIELTRRAAQATRLLASGTRTATGQCARCTATKAILALPARPAGTWHGHCHTRLALPSTPLALPLLHASPGLPPHRQQCPPNPTHTHRASRAVAVVDAHGADFVCWDCRFQDRTSKCDAFDEDCSMCAATKASRVGKKSNISTMVYFDDDVPGPCRSGPRLPCACAAAARVAGRFGMHPLWPASRRSPQTARARADGVSMVSTGAQLAVFFAIVAIINALFGIFGDVRLPVASTAPRRAAASFPCCRRHRASTWRLRACACARVHACACAGGGGCA